MSSHSEKNPARRRVPKRAGGERRVHALLEAAAYEIVEAGYEGATMKAIARRAGASIGTIYQYFPDKDAVVQELRSQYATEMDERWAEFAATAGSLSAATVGEQIITILLGYIEMRPAFIPLLSVPLKYERDLKTRNRLREHFAVLFVQKRPRLTPHEAFQIANVCLQIVKAMRLLLTEAAPEEHPQIGDEFRQVLSSYLASRLAD